MNIAEQGMAAYLGEDVLKYFRQITIGIAGAGGLGSNCAMHLVRSGFVRLVISDFDMVEPSNLNRQFYFLNQVGMAKVDALSENLWAINPDARITAHNLRIDKGNAADLFADCDVVVEALDDPAAKKMLAEAMLMQNKLFVAASGMGGCGRADAIVTRRLRDDFILVGDMETECGATAPPLAPMVGVAAAKQADAVLAHVLDRYMEEHHD
ncbi:sulfur carrier protein ThiS adenylyltransferase ThiF [Desulfovibrio ferrophilus]|uniref:Thiamine biosynthesis protein ThiF n=1 Tax=Desulfovibrio ferrophilus TaxID=241368 RepID=A0A2Z6AYF2_9BACT|nr:sulfur carrier protein ThiS adenylyltransferase ThiF [Desulfovibrio ferrophilus]BBD08195.1 thiamine biosynthesis protein ThiF [Desulfovibrio ferrophilus]